MIYNYIRNLDKELNETINLYKNVGKLSIPIFKYLILILSFFICTSCFVLLYYITSYNTCSSNNNNTNIFIDIILPIIIYGLICPIFSVIIGGLFKILLDNFIQKIKTKKLYLNYINQQEHKKLFFYLFNNKYNLIFCLVYCFIFFTPVFIHFIYLFIYVFIQLSRIFLFYKNKINCKIISVQNCNNTTDNHWDFDIEIDIDSEKKIITKRFTDFKILSQNIFKNIKLPTNDWIYKPNTLNEAKIRANELNKYITNITNNESILNNSTFLKFINTTNKYTDSNIILEKDYINTDNINTDNTDNINIDNLNNNIYSNIDKIKFNCSKLIKEPILNLFILNEINFYNSIKKRIIIFTANKLYKIKYYITTNIFEIRKIIDFIDIDYIEVSTIKNTTYNFNNDILIINFKNTNIKLTSITTTHFYNIYSLINIFQTKSIIIINIDSIELDNGYGITENILNNTFIHSIKQLYYDFHLF
jgi:hypothetical protein